MVIKLFSFSSDLSIKFQLLIKTKMLKIKAFIHSDAVFIMLVNVKMPTIVIVGILTFISMINLTEHEKNIITLGA